MKKSGPQKISKKVTQKNWKKQSSTPPLSLEVKPITMSAIISTNFSKTDEKLVKITDSVCKNKGDRSTLHKTLNLDKSLDKTNLKNYFFLYILRVTGFSMIPPTTLYDEYIDRPKLTEQKKPFKYIVPPRPPIKRSRNKQRNRKQKLNLFNYLLRRGNLFTQRELVL